LLEVKEVLKGGLTAPEASAPSDLMDDLAGLE